MGIMHLTGVKAMTSPGKKFENQIQESCNEQGVWFMRIKDVNIPYKYRRFIRVPRNEYDCLIYDNGILFPMELKSTNKKSISFSESVIKQHQIDSLVSASKFEGVFPGFLLNFREQPENLTYFVPIDKFTRYQDLAKNQSEHTYKCREGKKLNRASISLDICQEIGIELLSVKKQVNYRYFVKNLVDELSERYT